MLGVNLLNHALNVDTCQQSQSHHSCSLLSNLHIQNSVHSQGRDTKAGHFNFLLHDILSEESAQYQYKDTNRQCLVPKQGPPLSNLLQQVPVFGMT